MPEYLSPGVYVEETSFRAKSIEGVSTTVTGFIGPTRYGPTEGTPELLTSFNDFARIYGGIDTLLLGSAEQDNYMAYAVRSFFENGGNKLYVARIYEMASPSDPDSGKAVFVVGSLPSVTLRARFPGRAGNMQIRFAVRTSPNLVVADIADPNTASRVSSVRDHDLVYIKSTDGSVASGLYDVAADGDALVFRPPTGTQVTVADLDPQSMRIHRITLSVRALRAGRFEQEEQWSDLSPSPNGRNAVTALFSRESNSRERFLTIPFAIEIAQTSFTGAELLSWLFGSGFIDGILSQSLMTDEELENQSLPQPSPSPADMEVLYTLQLGTDGNRPLAPTYQGREASKDPNLGLRPSSGLETFADIDEISIVAAPGFSAGYTTDSNLANQIKQIAQSIIGHCQIRMKYRIAVLDAPDQSIVSEVQAFRGQFDSTHAALYYPWLKTIDPLDPDGRREAIVPPSGFVAGIYARTDILHGVSKAPANEVALGAIGLERMLNAAHQDVLNPVGINCFRFFPNRGYRLWGARTISSDPEWKYVNVRRYFAYVEHSIDRGTQWAVFEKNDDVLWANVRQTVYDFLYNEWRNRALLGAKPEHAFFVRCDRSTMTQNDLDNGRLVCLIGIAPIKPAEFVIFRIGQFTADTMA
jgi:phage tail sheath protein FI